MTEHHDRIAAVREDMRREGLDAVCVTGPEDVYYLTGLDHQGHFAFTALVLPATGEPLIVAREMEHTTLSVQVPWCRHVPFRDYEHPADVLLTTLGELPAARRLGVDKAGMWFPIDTWERISGGLPGADWVDTSRLVAAHREVKSPAEIDCIRNAAEISSAAMAAGLAAIRVGVDVRDVAKAIYAELIGRGSEYPGMAPLIRFRDALLQEHVTWRSRTVRPGDSIFVELSASVGRYHAPLTRMAYVGEPPAGTEVAAGIASDGLAAVAEALVPGTPAGEVYAAWQRVVDKGLGHDRYRRHHCGYQIGIGFPPSWVGGPHVVGLRSDSRWQVRAGMTFHVLSWLLDQEPADFVLSDTVLATDDGGQPLTTVSRQPIVIPV
ncbi:MAG: Xaa-Pro peptidase family protein [Actinomycetota bacterium]|nr:Xaa-Pro peptidase family protein [Actinomycetota bacterium]